MPQAHAHTHDPVDSYRYAPPASAAQGISTQSDSLSTSSRQVSPGAQSRQAGPSSSTDRDPGSARKPKGRKRMFKYLTEAQSAAAPGDDSQQGAAESSAAAQDSAASLTDGDVSAADGPATGELTGRKKVKKACLYCKRSHMPCEVKRPCARCTKRGIAHLCQEEAEQAAAAGSPATTATPAEPAPKKPRKSAPARAQAPAESSSAADKRPMSAGATGSTVDRSPEERVAIEAIEAIATHKPKLPISLLLSDNCSPPLRSRQSAGSADSPREENDSPRSNASAASISPRGPDDDTPPLVGGTRLGDDGTVTRDGSQSAERSVPPESVYRGGDSRLDHVLESNDRRVLERLIDGGDSVYDLRDAFGDKSTGILAATMGVSAGSESSTLAAMLPWKPNSKQPPFVSSRGGEDSNLSVEQQKLQQAAYVQRNPFFRDEALTAAALRGVPTYNYTWGYAKLALVSCALLRPRYVYAGANCHLLCSG